MMDNKTLIKSSNAIPSLDYMKHFKQYFNRTPSRTLVFVFGYINLFSNTVFALLNIPISIFIVTNILVLQDTILSRRIVEFFAKLDIDYLPLQTFENPVYTVILYSAVKCGVVALNAGCLVGVHLKKPGPIKLINFLSLSRIIYVIMAIVPQVHLNREDRLSIMLKGFEFGFAVSFTVAYYYYAKQLKQEASNQQFILSTEDVYIQFPQTIEKEKLCET